MVGLCLLEKNRDVCSVRMQLVERQKNVRGQQQVGQWDQTQVQAQAQAQPQAQTSSSSSSMLRDQQALLPPQNIWYVYVCIHVSSVAIQL